MARAPVLRAGAPARAMAFSSVRAAFAAPLKPSLSSGLKRAAAPCGPRLPARPVQAVAQPSVLVAAPEAQGEWQSQGGGGRPRWVGPDQYWAGAPAS